VLNRSDTRMQTSGITANEDWESQISEAGYPSKMGRNNIETTIDSISSLHDNAGSIGVQPPGKVIDLPAPWAFRESYPTPSPRTLHSQNRRNESSPRAFAHNRTSCHVHPLHHSGKAQYERVIDYVPCRPSSESRGTRKGAALLDFINLSGIGGIRVS
jgi:hypothetical protein